MNGALGDEKTIPALLDKKHSAKEVEDVISRPEQTPLFA